MGNFGHIRDGRDARGLRELACFPDFIECFQ